MSETGGGKEDIEVLREVLFKPLHEQNKARDKKLVQFVEQFGAKLTTRLRDLEKRVDLLAAEIDKRETMVSGIGEGIASLGQELRQLASKAESLQVAPASQQTASAQTDETEPRQREAARAERLGPELQPPEVEREEWDEPEPEPREVASEEWDEPEPQLQEAAGAESDEAKPRLRKTIRREPVQATLPSRGFG